MRYRHFFLFALAAVLLTACSGDSDNDKKSAPEKITSQVAEKAVQQIQEPLDKARKAAAATEEHNQRVKDSSN